jgi:hypothetical protein
VKADSSTVRRIAQSLGNFERWRAFRVKFKEAYGNAATWGLFVQIAKDIREEIA